MEPGVERSAAELAEQRIGGVHPRSIRKPDVVVGDGAVLGEARGLGLPPKERKKERNKETKKGKLVGSADSKQSQG